MDPFQKLKTLKTLFVDDDEFVRDSFGMIFSKKTCPLAMAATAEEGLYVLNQFRFDIIVSDYQLPGMDGLEFLGKAREIYPDSVNVLVSGNMTADEFDRRPGTLNLSFIPKPFNVIQLAGTLVALLENHRGHPAV